jgi:hypothetical protein
MNFVEDRRFSMRSYILGDEAILPDRYAKKLKIFLYEMMSALRDIEPALTLAKLRA